MSAICFNCGKTAVTGISQHHRRGVAGKRWKKRAQATIRLFRPNLQPATIVVEGQSQQVKLCTRCIKRFKKEGQLLRQQESSTVASL